jgi:nucleotide-binding universal stress UspA family protein
MASRRPVLCATDFSAASRPAFATALELAKSSRTELLVLHVLNPALPLIGDEAISPPTYDQLKRASRAWAARQLDGLIARTRAARVRMTPIVREGTEAAQIARLARSRRASMIVMGTHGRTGLKSVLLGSVAARVLTLAPCPVLTVRGP